MVDLSPILRYSICTMVTKFPKTSQKIPPTLLIILDGFGLADPKKPGNAITPETVPHIFAYMKKYPSTTLKAHGKDVGLFVGQEGNSEAGHFNIGAGRIVEQDLVRISEAIKNKTFFNNPSFEQAVRHAKKHRGAVHVMGLLTDGDSAHAHPEHLYALLRYCELRRVKHVYVHLFTDGRDSSPHSAIKYLKQLQKQLTPRVRIASIMGRFYAMDRNKLWHRTEMAYDAIVRGKAEHKAVSAEEAIEQGYNRNETDEYLHPTVIQKNGKPLAMVDEGDAVIFFNARSDRARQLTKAFVQPAFNKLNPGSFKRKKVLRNICFVAMSDFGPDLSRVLTAFPSPDIQMCLAKAIGETRKQLYISETEKYAHVTYFINGGFADPINGEDRELIRSSGHYTYADLPQMMTKEVTRKIIGYFSKGTYDFIVVNLPNADMVGHTGNFQAAKKAVHILDKEVDRLVQAVLKQNGQVCITADHGNAEQMIDEKTGEMMTEHTTNPVPFILISNNLPKKLLRKNGRLADVAPTILKLLHIPKPKEMTGTSLL